MQTRSMVWFALLMVACLVGCHLNSSKPRSLDDLLIETIDVAGLQRDQQMDLVFEEPPSEAEDADLQLVQHEIETPELTGLPVSSIFEEEDVRLAIQVLAEQAEANVIVDEMVSGTVTATITDQPFELALQSILMPLGYIWKQHKGGYLIGSADPASSLFSYLSETVDYRPSYHSPGELLPLLREDLQQYVRLIEKRNLMVIQAPPQIAHDILYELRRADQPVPQVLLEAIVAVHSPETSYQFGFDLRHFADRAALNGVNINLSSLAFSGSANVASLGVLFRNYAQTSYFLRCLEENGYLDISASPRVMARDGEKAEVAINRESFFSTQPFNAGVLFRQDIQKVEAGIVLDITPVIRGDTITLTIERAEVSEDIRETGADSDLANPYPLINRRTVTTTVDVKDGETVTIAGLGHTQLIDRVNRVPGLSRIPVAGKLFTRIDKQQLKNEVTVFISPRIVYPSGLDTRFGERPYPCD